MMSAGKLTFELNGHVIPSNGTGEILISDVGSNNTDALICMSEQSTVTVSNWFYRYGTAQQRKVLNDDATLGWKRNRARNPAMVREW